MRTKIATSSTSEDFASRFRQASPFLGVLWDVETRSKIEFLRREDGIVTVTFRTQGERVCEYTRKNGAGSLQVYRPTDRVDIEAWHGAVTQFYGDLPELLDYIKEGFSVAALAAATDDLDKEILTVVLAVRPKLEIN